MIQAKALKSFVWVVLGWTLLGGAGSVFWSAQKSDAAWFFALLLLSVADLFALAMTVKTLLEWVGLPEEKASLKPVLFVRILIWGTLKLVGFGAIGVVLFVKGSMLPRVPMFFGLATLIVVPLVGGLIWSQKEMKQ